MHFFTILRSIEEFLYDILTWLLFYPRTLWLCVRQPLAMMVYSDKEQHDAPDAQYTDSLSPPLLLVLSILLAHVVEVVTRSSVHGGNELGAEIYQSHEMLLVLRTVCFSIYPLLFAVTILRTLGEPIDRDRLRAPFFTQCYAAAPFALVMGITAAIARMPDNPIADIAPVLMVVATLWYLTVVGMRFRYRLNVNLPRAAWLVAVAFVKGSLVNGLIILAITR